MLPCSALELLSPAKDLAAGVAALDHGADAVYIGGPAFGARAQAGNTLEDVEALARYAHRFGARVFLALNTLLFDDELARARRLAFEAEAAGVDALIIQDMGLLAGELPRGVELHASTQCDVRTPEKARFLESAGFSQIVLARELTLEEIVHIREALSPETRIEHFIHGALCVSYSGACFMSEALLRRSANRGECAQLCRLPYDVFTEEGRLLAKRRHVLSLKDNNQTVHLESLIDAGVSSFKIEGRLKDEDYVKNITAHYRRAIDAILRKRPGLRASSEGGVAFSFEPDPEKTFNRGFTDYLTEGRHFDRPYALAALDSPKSRGAAAGTVASFDERGILVKPLAGVQIRNGDGLTFCSASNEMEGFSVNRAEPLSGGLTRLTVRHPEALRGVLLAGTELYRNRDLAFQKVLSGKSAVRTIPVTVEVKSRDGTVEVLMSDGKCTGTSSSPAQSAKDAGKSRADLAQRLARLGGTEFRAGAVRIPEDFGLFVPAGAANALRRRAVESLRAGREASRPRAVGKAEEEPLPCPTGDAPLFRLNIANREARRFYEKHGVSAVEPAFEIRPVAGADLMTCRHCVRAALGLCPKRLRHLPPESLEGADRSLFRPQPLILRNSAGERFEAVFHCRKAPCEMTIRKLRNPA